MFGDGYVGPHYVTDVELRANSRWIYLDGAPPFRLFRQPLDLEVRIDGKTALKTRALLGGGGRRRGRGQQPFFLAIPVPAGLAPGAHQLEVLSSGFVLPHDFQGNIDDDRAVSFRLLGVRVSEEDSDRRAETHHAKAA
jgi:hypothetical protein